MQELATKNQQLYYYSMGEELINPPTAKLCTLRQTIIFLPKNNNLTLKFKVYNFDPRKVRHFMTYQNVTNVRITFAAVCKALSTVSSNLALMEVIKDFFCVCSSEVLE